MCKQKAKDLGDQEKPRFFIQGPDRAALCSRGWSVVWHLNAKEDYKGVGWISLDPTLGPHGAMSHEGESEAEVWFWGHV